ncbi:hypothetical protein L198_06779 [Cryptococcus wingfieldii CBS 7118]|uniref:Uncharacterized protein n=1 Tax=Cryptococcus wingfieldii CBS 7118 TaxID=1295528 RepID=A0A1E3IHG1_9TREE|nr:hypothetical protein L198_06779 [Cryptococcus wingfieldii CBS 7118]ODN88040.1 hypothetical protein L198_06779 [Cryptococcus wingfieldii CBS 7118]
MAEAIKFAGHGNILDNVQRDAGREGDLFTEASTMEHSRLKAAAPSSQPSNGPPAPPQGCQGARPHGRPLLPHGIALNTIEHASSPGQETWDNICAIDDIVSFLCSDIFNEQPAFMHGQGKALSERGVVTVAFVRWNAAAGGVALATACDVVLDGRGWV